MLERYVCIRSLAVGSTMSVRAGSFRSGGPYLPVPADAAYPNAADELKEGRPPPGRTLFSSTSQLGLRISEYGEAENS